MQFVLQNVSDIFIDAAETSLRSAALGILIELVVKLDLVHRFFLR